LHILFFAYGFILMAGGVFIKFLEIIRLE